MSESIVFDKGIVVIALFTLLVLGIFVIIFRFITSVIKKMIRNTYQPLIPNELKGRPITVKHEPPDGLAPIDVGALFDRSIDAKDFFSVIVYLAVRGYVKIRATLKEIPLFPDQYDFEIVQVKDGDDLTHPADISMYQLLFDKRKNVFFSDLYKDHVFLFAAFEKLRNETMHFIADKGYFHKDRIEKKKIGRKSIAVALILVGFGSVVNNFTGISEWIQLLLFLTAIGGAVFIIFVLPRREEKEMLTAQGIETMSKILGFREYLSSQATGLNSEMFEKFLPYSMVLGISNEWARMFDGIYNKVPQWYEVDQSTAQSSSEFMQKMLLFETCFYHVFFPSVHRNPSRPARIDFRARR